MANEDAMTDNIKLYDKVRIKKGNIVGFVVDISNGSEGPVYTVEEMHEDATSDMHFNLEREDIEFIGE
jgi:hypothetical protein